MLIIFFIILNSIRFITCTSQAITFYDTFVNISDKLAVRDGHSTWYVSDAKRYKFPNVYTMYRMGFDKFHQHKTNLTISNQYKEDRKLPDLFDNHPKLELVALGTSSFIVYTKLILSSFLNPDIIYYKENIFITYRLTELKIKIIWLNKTSGFNYTGNIESDLNNLLHFNILTNELLPNIVFHGEDSRLFVYNDKLIVTFCQRNKRNKPDIAMKLLEILFYNNTITYDNQINLSLMNERGNEDQKVIHSFIHSYLFHKYLFDRIGFHFM